MCEINNRPSRGSGGLISDSYKLLNQDLHSRYNYGSKGDRWVDGVNTVALRFRCLTILDYGCGQGALRKGIGWNIAEYDPAIPGKDSTPLPADLVVCTDVLEHIEPHLLDNVLMDISRLANKCVFVNISLRLAVKFLSDGRNAHLIVESESWWRHRLSKFFRFESWELGFDNVTGIIVPVLPSR